MMINIAHAGIDIVRPKDASSLKDEDFKTKTINEGNPPLISEDPLNVLK